MDDYKKQDGMACCVHPKPVVPMCTSGREWQTSYISVGTSRRAVFVGMVLIVATLLGVPLKFSPAPTTMVHNVLPKAASSIREHGTAESPHAAQPVIKAGDGRIIVPNRNISPVPPNKTTRPVSKTARVVPRQTSPTVPQNQNILPVPQKEPSVSQNNDASSLVPLNENILCVFSGRWPFLRVNFAYIYRDLRKNEGVLDKVYYIMLQYDQDTLSKLTSLTREANSLLGDKVFELRFLNMEISKNERYISFYHQIFEELLKHPFRKYIKMDDDIVYIHPNAFRQLIALQNTSECFIHFANIGGANWRCSYIHQEMGIYNDVAINPKKLTFQFHPNADCGWKSPDCAEVAMKGFLHHYKEKSLDEFLFDGRYLLRERERFSINAFLIDLSLIQVKAMLESGPINIDDELWWSKIYARKVKNPSCVVGKAFVVHFSYFTTVQEMVEKRGYLRKFEIIAHKDLAAELPGKLQTILALNSTVDV